MDITIKEIDEGVIVSVTGRIDTTNYNKFENVMNELLITKIRQIFIDCSRLSYISSSGLRVFLTAMKKLTKSGGQFKIVAMQPPIKEIFDISGFSSIFSIYSDLETAKKK
jgi:anti-anti-sigma factor